MFNSKMIGTNNTAGGGGVPFPDGLISNATKDGLWTDYYEDYQRNLSMSHDGTQIVISRPPVSRISTFNSNYSIPGSGHVIHTVNTQYGEKNPGKTYYAPGTNVLTGIVNGGIGSVAANVSTTPYLGNFTLPSGSPMDICFVNGGYKAVILSSTQNIYIYNTTIPFRWHSATWTLEATYSTPRYALLQWMSDDGKYYFSISGDPSDLTAYQYSLSTPFDVSTATQISTKNFAYNGGVGTDIAQLYGFEFCVPIKRFFILGWTSYNPQIKIYTYNF